MTDIKDSEIVDREEFVGMFWLHVDPGTEHECRCNAPPDRPSLAVDLIRLTTGSLIEQTATFDVPAHDDSGNAFVHVKPRGKYWTFHGVSDRSSIWRRPALEASNE